MKRSLIILSLFFFIFKFNICFGQNFKPYHDAKRHFSVSIPDDWIMMLEYGEAYFLAYRNVNHAGETKVENVVLNPVDDKTATDINLAYQFSLSSISKSRTKFKLEKEGKSVKGSYKWFISSYTSDKTHQPIKTFTAV